MRLVLQEEERAAAGAAVGARVGGGAARTHDRQWSAGRRVEPARYFRRACEAAGIGRWTPYEMRHSAASLMSAAGVPLELVADMLGHTGTGMTALVYPHALARTVEAGATPMQRLLAKA